jgi:serine/threonine-protein phosphatase 2A activator
MTSATPPKLNSLEILDLSSPPDFTKPSKRINEGPDVARFLTSLAYRDIGVFILQLNRALCPRHQPSSPLPRTFPLNSKPPTSPSVQTLQALLAKIESFIDEAPPDPGPRRFGNVSFRKWYAIFEERLDGLLGEGLLGETLKVGKAKEEVSSYLLGGFGSVQRLDYGTGHELSFVAFSGCLWKLGYFKDGEQGGEVEREIVLKVIEP